MACKFEIYKDKKAEYRFRLKAGNGEIILASEGYKGMSGCKNGIASVQKNAIDGKRYLRKESKNGQFMFNLRAGNNQVIGTSEMYNTSAACENGIKSVMKNAPSAKVEEE
jgi:uncharacterized protein YegP (UPF0339 family)